MYNQKEKEGFIEDYMRSRVVAKTSLYSLFRKTELYEEKHGKDCSQFTEDEIIEMYKSFGARSHRVLLNYNVILKAYCAWQKYYRGLDVSTGYDNITTNMMRSFVPADVQRMLSREEITEIEDQLLNAADKAIVELLFEGISGKNMEDIYAVSAECVKRNVLEVNGKKFPMTDRLHELLPKAFAETDSMSYGETMRVVPVVGAGRIYKERCNVRGVDTPDSKFRYFYRRIQMFRDYLSMPGLTMKNISSSGLWHYLQIGMQESGLNLRGFLKTPAGRMLAKRYGFSEDYYLENICAKYE